MICNIVWILCLLSIDVSVNIIESSNVQEDVVIGITWSWPHQAPSVRL